MGTCTLERVLSDADQLRPSGELNRSGVLSDDEFARAKAHVLSSAAATSSGARTLTSVDALWRNRADRWIGGARGRIVQATGPDIAVRRSVLALALRGGSGVRLHVLLWIFVPLANDEFAPRAATPSP